MSNQKPRPNTKYAYNCEVFKNANSEKSCGEQAFFDYNGMLLCKFHYERVSIKTLTDGRIIEIKD